MSHPKKHHFVPQFLLKNFADDKDQLAVLRMSKEPFYSFSQSTYLANVRDIGHRKFGHSLFMPGREPDHERLESAMSDIEGAASLVVADLIGSKARAVNDHQKKTLGFLIALQYVRSRFLLDVVRRRVLGDVPVDDSNRSLGLIGIEVGVLDPWFARRRDVGSYKERFSSISDRLYGWNWRIFRPKGEKIIVGDNLVCMSGVTEGETSAMLPIWTKHGVGVGFGNCARITVPLSPNVGLVIARDNEVSKSLTATAFNEATIFNSREFLAWKPEGIKDEVVRSRMWDAIRTQQFVLPVILKAATA